MLKIENLSYTYKGKNASPVLRDISLELGEGFTFLVGENGSGKTTIIKP
jgi:ABC-type Mn2+/Zn2+ transport system ATPase subunit